MREVGPQGPTFSIREMAMTAPQIIFVSYGSFGDINPLLAIARAAAPRVPVAFLTNESYRAHVIAAGVPFIGVGTPEEQASCTETAQLSGRTMAGLMAQFRTHVALNVPRIAAVLRSLHAGGARPLLVTHGTINPVFPIAEQLGLPVARAYLAPSHLPVNREDFELAETFNGCARWRARLRARRHEWRIRLEGPPHARGEYNQARATAGIGAALSPWRRSLLRLAGRRPLALNVVAELLLTPAWYAEPLGESSGKVHCVGFPTLDQGAPVNAAEIDAFIGRHGAPLVFTPGTGVEDMEDFCRPIETACHRLGAPGILLARHGAAQFAWMQRVLNHPVMHVEYADLGWLLPKARALVHTGGIGTVAQAARAGIPQIVYPLFNDQPRNALRVLMNGLGGLLQGDGYTGPGIAALLNDIEASEVHRQCLAQAAAALREDDAAETAAALLIDCARQAADRAAFTTAVRLDATPGQSSNGPGATAPRVLT
jgi:rhamnosyltransferase subunit B